MKLKDLNKDIMITLPKTVAWGDYVKELDKAKQGEELLFKVPFLPKNSGPGCKCYLVYKNKVMGWMKISNFYDGNFKCSTTGKQWEGKFIARSGKFNKASDVVNMKGFRGFKYVT